MGSSGDSRDDGNHPLSGPKGGVAAPLERDAGESRRHFRAQHKLVWPVEVEPLEDPAGERRRTSAMTRGISVGGAFIETELALPVGTPVQLWLRPPAPPGGQPEVLRLRAEVRWRSDGQRDVPRGFGVAFRALTAADEIALHRYFSGAHMVV